MGTYKKYLSDFDRYDDNELPTQPNNNLGLDGDPDDMDLICFETAKLQRKKQLERQLAEQQSREKREEGLHHDPPMQAAAAYRDSEESKRAERLEALRNEVAERRRRSSERAGSGYIGQHRGSSHSSAGGSDAYDDRDSDYEVLQRVMRHSSANTVRQQPQPQHSNSSRAPRTNLQKNTAATNSGKAYANRHKPAKSGSVADGVTKALKRAVGTVSGLTKGSSGSRKRKPAEGGAMRIVKRCILVLALLLICWYAVIGLLIKDVKIERVDTHWSDEPPAAVSGLSVKSSPMVTNVLLLGIDEDGSSGSRSDTIMLASIDNRTGCVKLCSILRDCYVAIPEHKTTKINAAYAYGGAELAMRTVQNNFRVRINQYASIDRSSMIAVVEAVGGVDVEITAAEAKQINTHSLSLNADVSAGLAHLDGRQAVAYASIRKIDSDFNRTGRQRILLDAIAAKCKTLSPGKLMGVMEVVAPRVTTNMGVQRISSAGLKLLFAMGGGFEQMTIPAEGTYTYQTINGASMVVVDLEENARLLQEFLYG